MKHLRPRHLLFAITFVFLASAPAFAQFAVRTVNDNGAQIADINAAEALLASQPNAGSGNFDTLNFKHAGENDRLIGGGVVFPGVNGVRDGRDRGALRLTRARAIS